MAINSWSKGSAKSLCQSFHTITFVQSRRYRAIFRERLGIPTVVPFRIPYRKSAFVVP